MNRRNFIQQSGLAVSAMLLTDAIFGMNEGFKRKLVSIPKSVSGIVNGSTVTFLSKGKDRWVYKDVELILKYTKTSLAAEVIAPESTLRSITLQWNANLGSSLVLNDHWERTYGDVHYHKDYKNQILPWYFITKQEPGNYWGFGVKTGAAAFCSWQLNDKTTNLNFDLSSGGDEVKLDDRRLHVAEIVTVASGADLFKTSESLMQLMCDHPRMPQHPVYGINDWYFTYGNTSSKLIMEHTNLMAPFAEGLTNRPFSVIDAGWFEPYEKNPKENSFGYMDRPNAQFGDMSVMATDIKKAGMRPGLWTRPLCAGGKDKENVLLPMIKGREVEYPILDPTIPENLERVASYFKTYNHWGFELVKFDFTSYDMFGRWGFQMMKEKSITESGWKMYDNSKTNAEIVLQLYNSIRKAAGDTYIISCNTFSHLSAGIFEINRIGDDTSGREWERTRKMGVNTLAFRAAHHGTFYAADADCVGLTKAIDWNKNKQWLELVARSGTPLFISAQPDAIGDEQKKAIKQAFEWASKERPLGYPLNQREELTPTRWSFDGEVREFNWE